jgi:hypothetical protein
MLRLHWEAICIRAVAKAGGRNSSTLAFLSADCSANSTTSSAYFSKKGEKPIRIDVIVAHQTDEELEAEIVAAIGASGPGQRRHRVA